MRQGWRAWVGLLFAAVWISSAAAQGRSEVDWLSIDGASYPDLPVAEGRGGSFVGSHGGAVIVAGGSTFDRPGWEGGSKRYHREVFVLVAENDGSTAWIQAGELPEPRAHGAVVTTPQGLLCLGGENADGLRADALLIRYLPESRRVEVRRLSPRLPMPLKDSAAALHASGTYAAVYLAGGTTPEGQSADLFARIRLDTLLTEPDGATRADPGDAWQPLMNWPGPPRFGAALLSQFDGERTSLYLIGGKNGTTGEYLADGYRYQPVDETWSPIAALPRPALLAPHAVAGQAHLILASGSDGHDVDRWQEIGHDYHFPRDIFAYYTITDTWVKAGELETGVAGTTFVPLRGGYVLPGGELRPTVRSAGSQTFEITQTGRRFSTLDYLALGLYLVILVGIGIYFVRRDKNTDDFFLAGKRIPWWAAGLSLMATQVSSIGFMAIPAKSFSTDWLYFAGVATWFIAVPIVTAVFIPFYCKLNITSAYEYLEVRFHLVIRLAAAALYSTLQLGRIAIVLYLPALALSAVIGVDIWVCIVLMGVLSTIYTVAGGMEAVVWTDVMQAAVLLGGALLCIGVVLFGIDGGPSQFVEVAMADNKFRLADVRWDYTAPVLWVILVGNATARLANLSSDQSIVQRYLSTSDIKQARRALWTDVWVSIPWAVLIFLLGTALYVFYKVNPQQISPAIDVNGIVPFFIAHKIPAGLSGLLVAAIFAASMSSFDSAVHSVATVFTTDFYKRLGGRTEGKTGLWIARVVTAVLGLLGTVSALWLAYSDVKSIWDFFIEVLGLGGGILAGLFMLGAFTRRGNTTGAIVGLLASATALYLAKYHTQLSIFLYPAIGLGVCWAVGYLVSLVGPTAASAAKNPA